MGDGSGPGSWSLAASLLGSGIVVVPSLVAAGSVPAAIALTGAGCAGIALAGLLFVRRPFGRWPERSVPALPLRWRLGYTVGFTGGSGYFAASAASLLTVATPLGFWPALAAVLALAGVLALVPAMPGPGRTIAAVLAAVLVPVSAPVEHALGPTAAGQPPVLAALAGTALLAVGWESAASRHAAPRRVAVAAMICCLAFAGCTAWAGLAPHGGSAAARPVALLVALVLTVFLSGNLRGMAAFCLPAGRPGLRLAAIVPVLAVVALQQALVARGLLLVLPAVATLALYLGYAAGRPAHSRSAADRRETTRTPR